MTEVDVGDVFVPLQKLIAEEEEKNISPHDAWLQFKICHFLFLVLQTIARITSSKNNRGGG